ncbi:MAG: hypothetical protein JNM84_12975 [Planctomycetes bacterium]|nr:hypothetical protein [Planctomycetota bacterium]
MRRIALVSIFGTLSAFPALAQAPVISTIAGNGVSEYTGDGGLAVNAGLVYPLHLAVDGAGNLYFSDWEYRIRRIDATTGILTTVAGGGAIPYPNDGALATAIQIGHEHTPVAVDPAGNLYFADYGGVALGYGDLIRRVDATTGIVTTVAGGATSTTFVPYVACGDSLSYPLDSGDGGLATAAYFVRTNALALDPEGNLYAASPTTVRRVDRTTGIVTKVAGNGVREVVGISGDPCNGNIAIGTFAGDGGPAVDAGFIYISALAFDRAGHLYVADDDAVGNWDIPGRPTNHRVRRIDALSGIVTTVCGTSQVGYGGFSGDGGPATQALIGSVGGLAIDAAGNLFISDSYNSRIRRVDATTGFIETIAGDGSFGYAGDGGLASAAVLNLPWGIALTPSGELLIGDIENYRIRRISGLVANLPPTAVAGQPQSIHASGVVQLDGSASFDDNTPSANLLYDWSLVLVPSGSTAVLNGAVTPLPSFLADVPGTYIAELVVTDEAGLASTPSQVVISSTNLAPIANAGIDQGGVVDQLVLLDGSASVDPELDPLSFTWALTSYPAGSNVVLFDAWQSTATFVPDLPGLYVAALIVDDGFGPSLVDEVVITVITGEEYAENLVLSALDLTAGFTAAEIANSGHQNALVQQISRAAQNLQDGNLHLARLRLDQALLRTDGCVLRGQPDASGAGRDWVTDCSAQLALYAELAAARALLEP